MAARVVARAAVDISLASDVPLRYGHTPEHGELDRVRFSRGVPRARHVQRENAVFSDRRLEREKGFEPSTSTLAK